MDRAWFLPHKAESPSTLPKQGWREVPLPHQWSLDGIEAEVGWYRISLPAVGGGRRLFARVLADYFKAAWVNGAHLGNHEGYFEPWIFEVPGGEILDLRVAAPKEPYGTVWPRFKRQVKGVFGQHDCRPGGTTGRGQERGTGGLWGGIELRETGDLALLHLAHRAYPLPGGWRLVLQVDVDALAPRRALLRLDIEPQNFDGERFAKATELELGAGRRVYTIVWDLPEMPLWEVWERGFPHLFRLRAVLGDDSLEVPLGFRTIAEANGWLVLNGKRLFLRGTNIIPAQWLAAYGKGDSRRDVALLKEVSLNAVRVHAHLTAQHFYDACDREGILVWQDFPLQWGYATDEGFAREAMRQARAMVKHFGAHPAIYLWCAQNEPTHNRHILGPALAAEIRQADPTRLTREASDFREHPYPGWYWGSVRDFLALPGAPLPSEFGAQALPRAELLRRVLGRAAWPPDWERWVYHNFQPDQTFRVAGIEQGSSLEAFVENSQAYQATLLRFAIHAYRRAKGRIAGYFQFMFVDPWEGITWSVLDVERVPKQGFFALKEASSPILLSLVPYRETLEVGQFPLSEVWLINDLDREVSIRVEIRLEGPARAMLWQETAVLKAQEARLLLSLGQIFEAPLAEQSHFLDITETLRNLQPGRYRLVGEAWEAERLQSRDQIDIEYVEPLGRAGVAW